MGGLLQTLLDIYIRNMSCSGIKCFARKYVLLGTHTQINAITFTFESGETKMWGKAGRGAQGDVLDLADGEYLVRVAGRCDEARPRPNGTLVSVTLTTSRYRELTSG